MSNRDLNSPILNAINDNDIKLVKLLLQDECIDINKSYNNITPFNAACIKGNIDMVKLLLQNDKLNVYKSNDDYNIDIPEEFTHDLHFNTQLLENHLESYTSYSSMRHNESYIIERFRDSMSPINNAVKYKHIDIIKLLLEDDRIDVNKPDKYKWTPLDIACYQGYIDIVKLLLENTKLNIVDSIYEHFNYVFKHEIKLENQNEILNMLLEDGRIDVNIIFNISCSFGFIDIVRLLIDDERIDINKQNKNMISPLCAAIQKQHVDIIKLLLDNNEINLYQMSRNVTAFWKAIYTNNNEIIKLLIENKNFDINEPISDDENTPLYLLCSRAQDDLVKILLDDETVNVNKSNQSGITPFNSVCRTSFEFINTKFRDNFINIFNMLLKDSRTDINKPDDYNTTPFNNACSKGDIYIVKTLLDENITDINKPDNNGDTPFINACTKSTSIDVIKLLLSDDRIDVSKENNDGNTALNSICNMILKNMDQRVISKIGYKNFDDNCGVKEMYEIVRKETIETYCEIIKLLLNDGRIDINKPNNKGMTALDSAKLNDNIEFVNLLS